MLVPSQVNASVQRLIERQVDEGRQIGVQVCAYHRGARIVDAWAGRMGPADPRPVGPDALFLAWSAGKGVAALLVHQLVDRGLLAYDEPVARYWPAFGQHGKDRVTVAQALSHQAGVHAMPTPFQVEHLTDWEAGIRWVEDAVPAYVPGTTTGYHADNDQLIFGGLVRAVTRRHSQEVLSEHVLEPLEIADALFVGIPDDVEGRLATIELRAPGYGMDPPTDPDWLAAMPTELWALLETPAVRRACLPSSNGYMSARALAKIYGALAADGVVDGVRLVSRERVPDLYRFITDDTDIVLGWRERKGIGFLLGGELDGERGPMGPRSTAFGRPGAGGPIGFADTEVGLAVAVLSNRMWGVGEPDATKEISDLIRAELGVA